MFALTDLLAKDFGTHILSPILGLSLLSLFAGVIISMRQNRRLQHHRAIYAPGGSMSTPLALPDEPPPVCSARPVWKTPAASPAELTLLHNLAMCLPRGITPLHGLRAGDLLEWEGGTAPSASLPREPLDCVLCDARTGTPLGVILLTGTRGHNPLLNPAIAASGLPVLHLEALRPWTPDQLTYLLQEGLGLALPAWSL